MNILGESFETYVDEQVKVRQDFLGRNFNSSDSNLAGTIYKNSKVAYVRLMSSVEFKGNSNYKFVNSLGLKGLELAKKYVLFAGTSPVVFTDPGVEAGTVAPRDSSTYNELRYGISSEGAYGTGGKTLGFRPMMGISSIEVKTDGDGYTTSAVVKIKAYNSEQLEIIEALYLRLGYYMLLEWGNVVYVDNKFNIFTDGGDNTLQEFFFDPAAKYISDMLSAIKTVKKESNGNYDALFGKVINFNWSYSPDGTFDITLNLRSVGDIIEGLKMNSQKLLNEPAPIDANKTTPDPIDLYRDQNAIGALYYTVAKKIIGATGYVWSEVGTPITGISVGEKTFARLKFQGSATSQYYVKFNRLLAEIQSSYVLRFNGDPSLKINYERGKNLIPVNELTISADPRVCIVSRTDTINPQALFPGATNVDSSFTYEFFKDLDPFLFSSGTTSYYGDLMNVYVNFDFLLEKINDLVDEKTNRVSLKQFLNEVLNEISRALGSSNTLEVFVDQENNELKIIDKNPYPYRDTVLQTVGATVRPTTTFNVSGFKALSGQDSQGNPITFIGEGSMVKQLDFQTTIPPDFATIISIGAAANKKSVGEDTTAFSRLNRGLFTRFAEIVTDGNESSTNPDDTPDSLIGASGTFFQYVVGGGDSSNIVWQPEVWEANKSILSNLVYFINKGKANEYKSNSTVSAGSGFIPINVSLTMDGLSGMKIFQKFNLNTEFLPSNYPDAVEILIKGITHTVKNNLWETKIDSVIVGKSADNTAAAPAAKKKKKQKKASSSGGSYKDAAFTGVGSADPATGCPSNQRTRTDHVYVKSEPSGWCVDKYQLSSATDQGSWGSNLTIAKPKIFPKSRIYLHHTATYIQGTNWAGDKGLHVVEACWNPHCLSNGTSLRSTKGWVPSAPFVLDGDGHVERLADERFKYITQGSKFSPDPNVHGIGIEVINPGQAFERGGDWFDASGKNISKGQRGQKYQLGFDGVSGIGIGNGISNIVDWNLNPTTYRTYKYGFTYTGLQMASLRGLLLKLMYSYKIPFIWEGEKTWRSIWYEVDEIGNGLWRTKPGIYSHGSVFGGKVDLVPTLEVVSMLISVGNNGPRNGNLYPATWAQASAFDSAIISKGGKISNFRLNAN